MVYVIIAAVVIGGLVVGYIILNESGVLKRWKEQREARRELKLKQQQAVEEWHERKKEADILEEQQAYKSWNDPEEVQQTDPPTAEFHTPEPKYTSSGTYNSLLALGILFIVIGFVYWWPAFVVAVIFLLIASIAASFDRAIYNSNLQNQQLLNELRRKNDNS